jgi:hypothetical protein
MRTEWSTLTKQVQAKQSSAASWKSDQKSLQEIIKYAESEGMDPTEAAGSDISKLRTIIKEARAAISSNNPDRLNELFHLAATLSIVDLRLTLGTTHPEVIYVERMLDNDNEIYTFSLLPEEFERIKLSMRLFYEFLVYRNVRTSLKTKELLPSTTTLGTIKPYEVIL